MFAKVNCTLYTALTKKGRYRIHQVEQHYLSFPRRPYTNCKEFRTYYIHTCVCVSLCIRIFIFFFFTSFSFLFFSFFLPFFFLSQEKESNETSPSISKNDRKFSFRIPQDSYKIFLPTLAIRPMCNTRFLRFFPSLSLFRLTFLVFRRLFASFLTSPLGYIPNGIEPTRRAFFWLCQCLRISSSS